MAAVMTWRTDWTTSPGERCTQTVILFPLSPFLMAYRESCLLVREAGDANQLFVQADILVATTVIENGIDMPNVNTIIIDHADRYFVRRYLMWKQIWYMY